MPTSVIVADDHPIVLDGLAQLLAGDERFVVVALCNDGEQTLEAIREKKPDIALVDVRMPHRDGVGVLRAVVEERLPTRVVLLTAQVTDDEVIEAVRLGVAGMILKETASRQLINALHEVAEGGKCLDQKVVRRALDKMLRMSAGLAQAAGVLTNREIEVVRLVAAGLRNKQIADQLLITEGTVKIHLHTVFEKLGVSSRMELSNYARDRALL
jgi:two-component system, NarL family, nitrate/nitrite response regulator NarL